MPDFEIIDSKHLELLKAMLVDEEGLKLKPYRCTAGKLTIGIGRNLDDKGITDEEANYLFKRKISSEEAYQLFHNGITRDGAYYLCENDIHDSIHELIRNLPFFASLDPIRKIVLIDMCFNMGIGTLLGFKNTLALIKQGDYEAAAKGMLNSKWAKQVGRRAVRLSKMMETGKYQEMK